MKRNCFKTLIKRVFTLSWLCACLLLFLLSACDRADLGGNTVDPEPELPTGEMITVSFTVSDIGFVANEVVTRAVGKTTPNPFRRGTFSSPLGGDRGGSVSLRADTVPLAQDVIVRIVVYAGSPLYDTYYGYADYRMDGGLLTPYPAGSPNMSVPIGNYRFVAYSFNSDNPGLMPAFSPTTAIIGSQDLLWGKEDNVNITPLAATVHITMQHKMAKVVVHATAENLFSLNSIDTEIYGYQPVLTVQNGVLSPGSSLVGMPFVWNIANPALLTQTSDTLYVFTNEDPVTELKINQMSIEGIAYTDPRYASYTKPLEAGKSYTLHVNFTRAPSGGSAARITWEEASPTYLDGRYIITNDPRDAGLFFKYGGVVGIFSGEGEIQSLAPPIPSTDTLFQYPRDIAWTPVSFSDWPGIPNATVKVDSILHTVVNIWAGLGDPCRLVEMNLRKIRDQQDGIGPPLNYNDIDNGTWRLPTPQENRDFSGQDIGGSWPYPTVWWWGGIHYIPNHISFGVTGGEFPERHQGGTSKFLPAAGRRNNLNGAIIARGVNGYYWANDLSPTTYGSPSCLGFSDNMINDQMPWGIGANVRCVRQAIEFEIEVNDWIPGGTLGLGGEGDIILF